MFQAPRGARHYNIGAHLFGSKGLGGSGVGAGVTTWGQAIGMRPSPKTFGGGSPIVVPRPVPPVTLKPDMPGTDGHGWRRTDFPTLKKEPVDDPTKKKDDPKNTDDFSTLADAFSHGLSMQPVSTQDATPTVIMDPNSGSGSGMNVKGILILLGVAGLAWFAWKKWGSKAVAAAES